MQQKQMELDIEVWYSMEVTTEIHRFQQWTTKEKADTVHIGKRVNGRTVQIPWFLIRTVPKPVQKENPHAVCYSKTDSSKIRHSCNTTQHVSQSFDEKTSLNIHNYRLDTLRAFWKRAHVFRPEMAWGHDVIFSHPDAALLISPGR